MTKNKVPTIEEVHKAGFVSARDVKALIEARKASKKLKDANRP
jgi:hypothetical protein